jgi:hypothetical protein
MSRALYLVSVFFIVGINISIGAQERQTANTGMAPELRMRALVLDINARVLEEEQGVVWEQSLQRMAIPGSPVSIRMVGSNIILAVQFTPIIRRRGNILVAHGQIWINDPVRGMCYYTSIQTIPMEFNEQIFFFPLGTSEGLTSIEIIITVKPYREAEETAGQ